MSSQFFGLTVAASGLFTYNASLTTTANNIANVKIDGYSRQEAVNQAAEALRVNAKYGTAGSGVETVAIKQIRNQYYDTKYWNNNPRYGLYERRLYYTRQIETAFADANDIDKGFSTLLDQFFNNMEKLNGDPGNIDVRSTVVGAAQNLCDYFNGLSSTLKDIQLDCNQEIAFTVDNINSIAQKVAILNKQINVVELSGGYANELRDKRALLIDELSQITPTTVEEYAVMNSNNPDDLTGATDYKVRINGQLLVDNFDYRTLACVARDEKVNQCDIEGLYDIVWTDVGNKYNVTGPAMTGSLKALFDVRDGNNEDNFNGTVSTADNGSLTVRKTSQNTVDEMTMSESGIITINNKDYSYSSFEREEDASGNVSYKFYLKTPVTSVEAASMCNMKANIGKAIDFMGVPYYTAQMNTFLRSFCQKFNEIEYGNVNGTRPADNDQNRAVDANGNNVLAFFTAKDMTTITDEFDFDETQVTSATDTYYKLTAENVRVNPEIFKDCSKMSTETYYEFINGISNSTTIVSALQKLKSDVTVFRGESSDNFLKCITSDISISAQESEVFEKNYASIMDIITNQRMSISGVDEDEEAMNLVKFQNAYNLSSKMVQTLTEIYDRLILETGV